MITDEQLADLDDNPVTDHALQDKLASAGTELLRRIAELRALEPSADAVDWLDQRRRAVVCLEYVSNILSDYVFDGTAAREGSRH